MRRTADIEPAPVVGAARPGIGGPPSQIPKNGVSGARNELVEHHQEFQIVWNGNGGRVYFYQCEVPYDPPDQASYTRAPGTNGWAAYKVADKVTSHEAWGLGVYSVFRNKGVALTWAFEAPNNPNVRFTT